MNSDAREDESFPVLTSVLVVCRQYLSSCNAESRTGVERLIDEYLNTFSSRLKVWQACRLGRSRRALEYLAAHDPDWGNGGRIAEHAVIRGFLHVIKWVGECYPDRTSWISSEGNPLMDDAAEFGHISVLEWLHANRSEGCTTGAMDRAAAVGNLEVVQWLHEHCDEGCTTQAMNDAAAHGHLRVVEWLHENRSEGCSKSAICSAAANDHLAVVRFLLENRREVCTADAMRCAAENGHLELVQWLYVNRGDSHVGAALRYAAKHGHTAMVEWLYWIVREQRRGDTCIRDAARIALEAGHKRLSKQLERKLKRPREAPPSKAKQRAQKRKRLRRR
ncbi:unnamed protein product [Phytophthora lilii]|uniref:Unnamed protein product n=1 Tax=Phytophthora lilii TaxID=2077276 RepID=A0A9W6TVZ8_9STRA|nr:unnamed protein product [Phytophthora lilii]